MNLQAEIQQYIVKKYLKGEAPDGFDADYSLIGNNLLDSIAVIDLIAYIEQTYQIEFGDYDITPENFETITALVAFIKQKRA